MKTVSRHIAFIITEVIVKTYMFISVMWSKGNERYRSIQVRTTASASRPSAA